MTEDERKAIVESGPVFLQDGLRAQLAGWGNPEGVCSVSSARPGFWCCSWETAAEVVKRDDRRFRFTDYVWRTGHGWLGVTPGPDDFQTPEDYERAKLQGKAR
jgi:hypothetical protein